MPKGRHTAEQIIGKLREAEVHLARGATVQKASRALGIVATRATIHQIFQG